MALVKGNKPVKKPTQPKKIKLTQENDPSFPYLKKEKLSLLARCISPIHYFCSIFFEMNIILGAMLWPLIVVANIDGYIPDLAFFGYIVLLILSYHVSKNTPAGRLSYFNTDGTSWWQVAELLPPKNPSPGQRVVGTQLAHSRFLIVPGPQSSHNGFFKKVVPFLLFTSGIILVPIIQINEIEFEYNEAILMFLLAFFWIFGGSFIMVNRINKPLGEPRRFYIFDRQKQTVSYHTSFVFRKMVTYPWLEFEGRTVAAYRHGYLCKFIHAPTGNVLELQGADLHWNGAKATEAYSYVARFMDLSQSLPDEKEFERYLPEAEDLSHLDTNEYFAYMDKKDEEREAKRKKYHNPSADAVFVKMGSFNKALQEHPWLSARNIWAASHRYGLKPNWDKWVRDKWGLAANEDYQVPNNEREGEPAWFPQFLEFLVNNKKKIKSMDDETRILFTQEWFEETFPELHWVDPVTADRYEQEEEFA